jgi:hypothetical protein
MWDLRHNQDREIRKKDLKMAEKLECKKYTRAKIMRVNTIFHLTHEYTCTEIILNVRTMYIKILSRFDLVTAACLELNLMKYSITVKLVTS